jgi:shikimate 5-dehydrogenase
LVGYNTDWIGIQRPILKLLLRYKKEFVADSSSSSKAETKIGLVIGAGGTARAACYAVKDLGLRLVVANRNEEKAKVLAEQFGGEYVSLEDLAKLVDGSGSSAGSGVVGGKMEVFDPSEVAVLISTLPFAAGFTAPPALLLHKPVVLDVVYKPARTALATQALGASCPFVQGASMLLEQGIEQFELWNGRRAPVAEMTKAIFAGAEKIDST